MWRRTGNAEPAEPAKLVFSWVQAATSTCERIRGLCVLCVPCGEYKWRSNLPPRLSRIVGRVDESRSTTSCMRRAPCPRMGNADPAEPAKLVFLWVQEATSTE